MKALRKLFPSAPQVRYTNDGRGGTVHYISPESSFDMWFEFAGGSALAIINIPTPQYWESRTKLPLAQRSAVLEFIGQQVVNDQASGGYFELSDDFITIYSGKKPNG